MTTTDLTTTEGRWGARTATGPADFTSVATVWREEDGVYVTRVDKMLGAAWTPLEVHRSATEDEARKTHRAAVRRHPKKGTTRTLPRRYDEDDRCSRCGEQFGDPHHERCRD